MPLTFVFFTYLNAWFVTLFAVLPFFIHDARAQGVEYAAAPRPVRWKRAFLVNTLVSAAITAGLAWLVGSGLISVRDLQ